MDAEFGRTTDPVRMYMREMGTVELLTREGEIEIAKRIEDGLKHMVQAISACPTTIAEMPISQRKSNVTKCGSTSSSTVSSTRMPQPEAATDSDDDADGDDGGDDESDGATTTATVTTKGRGRQRRRGRLPAAAQDRRPRPLSRRSAKSTSAR